ncbi:MAG TPA: prolyl oligopeptidase family serine peptidase, partial [Abditibacteriaceae bacterium]
RPDNNSSNRAFIRDYNIWLREGDKETQLTNDGSKENAYTATFSWSPDGSKYVVRQVKPAQEHKVYLVESSPADQLQPKLKTIDYLKPGDQIEIVRPRLFDAKNQKEIPISDALFSNPWSITNLAWDKDNSAFSFVYNQRGHQVMRFLRVDAETGTVKTIIEENSPTFIDYSQKTYLHRLDKTNEVLWASERDGYNHLYLFDAQSGKLKQQITRGNWMVREVEKVDEEKRRLLLRVMGIVPGQDPYYEHLARVNFDGSDFKILTEGDGTHKWQFSPDGKRFINTFSRVDSPPVINLRDAQNGALLSELEKADVSELLKTGWTLPERFTAKGRDRQTDIYGIIIRPSNFDAAKKYPVIEAIYAGPHDFFTPKSFSTLSNLQKLAELGFIVVKMDGMGTNWRGKKFHDVAWKNLKDAGFPDRIAWMKEAAKTRPWMDLSRVGIYGGSAGGQSALGALLFHGDFYKAAAADCGCHDNRMDKIWWNEAWMGWPIGPEYADNSNVTHAKNLQGKLLLTVGELDTNVDPASTMQVADALIKAGKDFELIVFPGAGHGASESPYGQRRRMDFFVRHLFGVEPRSR